MFEESEVTHCDMPAEKINFSVDNIWAQSGTINSFLAVLMSPKD